MLKRLPSKAVFQVARESRMDDLYGRACQGVDLLVSDYEVARTAHRGLKARLRRSLSSAVRSRDEQRRDASLERAVLGRLVLAVDKDNKSDVLGVPESVQEALAEGLRGEEGREGVVSFRHVLAMVGVSELRRAGCDVGEGVVVRPRFGVFAPTRPAYCSLFRRAKINFLPRRALDVGTGTGVLAVLTKKRFPKCSVWATDISERAVECAEENLQANSCHAVVEKADLFPSSTSEPFDLIVFNPPWMPTKGSAASAMDAAVFDYKFQTLKRFLKNAPLKLTESGRVVLLISNLGELEGVPGVLPVRDLVLEHFEIESSESVPLDEGTKGERLTCYVLMKRRGGAEHETKRKKD